MFEQSILWSSGVIAVSFCICFMIMYFCKFDCITYKNNKGNTVIDYRKLSLISAIISVSLGISVFIFLLSKENKTFNENDVKIELPKSQPVFRPSHTWSDPI